MKTSQIFSRISVECVGYGAQVEGKSKVVPVLRQVPRHEGVLGSGVIAPRIPSPLP